MKVALVGIGKIAVDQHVPAISKSDDWELAATVSRHGTVDGVQGFTDIDTMLADMPDVPVISLCLPPQPRFAYAAKALAAGRHVMLEKPPGATLAECHALKDLAQKQGVTLFATWHSREAAQVDNARDWLKDKQLTKLHISWKENVRQWHPGQDWIFAPGGLGVFDPGINALSILTKILPDPVHLTKALLTFPANKQTPIAADLTFNHPTGAEVTAAFDWLEPGEPDWTITAETVGGTLRLSEGGGTMTIDGDAGPAPDEKLSGEYPRLYKRMAELVAGGQSEVDLSPMRHVADAFTLGERRTGPEFHW